VEVEMVVVQVEERQRQADQHPEAATVANGAISANGRDPVPIPNPNY